MSPPKRAVPILPVGDGLSCTCAKYGLPAVQSEAIASVRDHPASREPSSLAGIVMASPSPLKAVRQARSPDRKRWSGAGRGPGQAGPGRVGSGRPARRGSRRRGLRPQHANFVPLRRDIGFAVGVGRCVRAQPKLPTLAKGGYIGHRAAGVRECRAVAGPGTANARAVDRSRHRGSQCGSRQERQRGDNALPEEPQAWWGRQHTVALCMGRYIGPCANSGKLTLRPRLRGRGPCLGLYRCRAPDLTDCVFLSYHVTKKLLS
jgi:hypothetical protein